MKAHVWIVALSVLIEILHVTTTTDWYNTIDIVHMAPPKNCSSSSYYIARDFDGGDCRGAMNYNFNTDTERSQHSRGYHQNCFFSSPTDSNPFWAVDLLKPYRVHKVTVTIYKPARHRFTGLKILLDEVHVYTYNNVPHERDMNLHAVFPQRIARHVKLTKSVITPGDSVPRIQFCEVQVFSCMNYYWGEGCETRCGSHCFSCDSVTSICDACHYRFWGVYCNDPCSPGCAGIECNKTDGACECKPRRRPPYCRECLKGYWGPECQYNCSTLCNSTGDENFCNATTGQCLRGCIEERWGDLCNQVCPEAKCLVCNRNNGHCMECKQHKRPPQCTECLKDYWGPQCEHSCSTTCKGRNEENYCDAANGHCLKGCIPGYWGKNCSNLCGAGCKTQCNQDTAICECNQGWAPNLCTGCLKDKWGPQCENSCSTTCKDKNKDNHCDVANGHCLKGCIPGYWGKNCSKVCGAGCKTPCNQDTAICECHPFWLPNLCKEKACLCEKHQCLLTRKYVFSDLPRKINVALGKVAIASTLLDQDKHPACFANDGHAVSKINPSPMCMSTAKGDLKPFWQVDLGKQHVLAGVLIDWEDQMKSKFGISLILDNKKIFYSEKEMDDPTYVPTINAVGRVVRLQREKFKNDNNDEDPMLKICEVEVYSCRQGYYGPDCEVCNEPICKNMQICSRIDGSCQEKKPEPADCSPLILVAGCFVAFLVITLFTLAGWLLPHSKPTIAGKKGKGVDASKTSRSSVENESNEGSTGTEAEKEEGSATEKEEGSEAEKEEGSATEKEEGSATEKEEGSEAEKEEGSEAEKEKGTETEQGEGTETEKEEETTL